MSQEVTTWKGSDWKSVDVTIGAMIKAGRAEIGIHQAALADKVGVSGSAVSQWEHGKTLPTGEAAVTLGAEREAQHVD